MRARGRTAAAAPRAAAEVAEPDAAEISLCRTPADLYGREARRTIAQVLARTLEAWALTPMELLHDVEAYRRLVNAGTPLQSAVQRAAVLQSNADSGPVGERIRTLHALIDAAVRELHGLSKTKHPDLADRPLADAAAALAEKGERARNRQLAIAIAGALRPVGKHRDKLEQLAGWLEEPLPDWAGAILDAFIAERLVCRGLLEDLLGLDTLAERLEACARLSAGRLRESRSLPEALARIDSAVAEGRLAETATALVEHVFDALAHHRHATGESLDREFAALARLLATAGEDFGAAAGRSPLREAFEERCRRLLNPQGLAAYIAEGGPLDDRIDRLLALVEHAVGESNQAILADWIRGLLDDPDNRAFWEQPTGASFEHRMKAAARLQRRLLAGPMPAALARGIADRLDRFCTVCLERSALLARLREDGDAAGAGRRLLRMLAAGEVTEGEARRRVAAEARRYLADPAFLAPIERAASRAERTAAARELEQLLRRARLAGDEAEPEAVASHAGP